MQTADNNHTITTQTVVYNWHIGKTNAIRAITHVSAEGLESATRYIA